MILNGPATDNYDIDLGALFLQDWSHTSVFTLWNATTNASPKDGIPPASGLESTLINGTNVFNCPGSTDPSCIGGGKKFTTVFESDKKYLIRLINVAVDGQFQFSIDGHNLTVIATDLVPIEPYNTSSVLVSIGQRCKPLSLCLYSLSSHVLQHLLSGHRPPNQPPLSPSCPLGTSLR